MPAKTKPIPEVVQELWELLRDYARQEMVDPVKDLKSYVTWGLAGAVFITLGLFFLALGGLRVLQTQTGELFDDGVLSSVPYLIVVVALAIVVGVAASRIGKGAQRKNR